MRGDPHDVPFKNRLVHMDTAWLAVCMFWTTFGVSLFVREMPVWGALVIAPQVAVLSWVLFAWALPHGPKRPRVVLMTTTMLVTLVAGIAYRSST